MIEIHLIPYQQWGKNARSELTTTKWRELAHHVYQRDRFACRACGIATDSPHAHEVFTYTRPPFLLRRLPFARGVQKLVAIQTLCADCHEATHLGLADKNGRGAQARAHLCRVNHWGADELAQAQIDAFRRVQLLSRYRWRLDVSLAWAILRQ